MATSETFDCSDDTLPLNFSGVKCFGLAEQPYVDSAEGCREVCCGSSTCLVWQWCPPGGDCMEDTCWIGDSIDDCGYVSEDWVGGGRDTPPPTPEPATSCNITETPECGGSSFDDSDWRSLNVPHDFVVEGTFDPSADKDHGYLPFGIAWYRKHFFMPAEASNTTNTLVFDGVMVSCEVYLNGVLLGTHDGGYTPFRFDLSSADGALSFGDDDDAENVLAVKVDATNPDSWWYDGGGIYRHVWVECVVTAAHVGAYGVYAPATVATTVKTTRVGGSGEEGSASVVIDTPVLLSAQTATSPATVAAVVDATVDVKNSGSPAGVTAGVRCAVYAASDVERENPLATAEAALPSLLKPFTTQTAECGSLDLPEAQLWSVEFPVLYVLYVEVVVEADDGDQEVTDMVSTRFGVRTLAWDPDHGLFLNGQAVKILGCANHQDFAGVGVAVPDSLQAFRIRKLQDLGGNAWRTAHNAPTTALLDWADEMGMLVWDENHRNGMTDDAQVLVRRDRNHPSIIIWSICNEVLCDVGDGVDGPQSLAAAQEIRDVYETWDPSGSKRVVSANQNGWVYNGSVLDLLGYDYATSWYDSYHSSTPSYPAVSSETSSAVSDRGEYSSSEAEGHVTGYDTEAPSWGQTAQQAWGGIGEPQNQGILTRNYMAGGFVWTGFDYKGEPTPYAWPDINSHFGIYDIAGFPKDRAYWYQAWWQPDTPLLHLFPHWNWDTSQEPAADSEDGSARRPSHLAPCKGMCRLKGKSGNSSSDSDAEVDVWVFTNYPEVELLVNDESFGRVQPPQYAHASWTVPYAPGTLQVKAYSSVGAASEAEEASLETVGAPSFLALNLKDDGVGQELSDDGSGVLLLVAQVLDDQGRVVPTTDGVNVTFSVLDAGASASGDGAGGEASSKAAASASASAAVEVVGTGNGDPADHTGDTSSTRPAYHGLVLGLVRAVNGIAEAGQVVTVQASAPNLKSAALDVTVTASTFAYPRI